MRYVDWGERSGRWAGIRSETVEVPGAKVHMLRKDASPAAPLGAPTHLLVHPMASGATMWLDVLGPLSTHGPVIVPDLPGAVFGHTASPHRLAARAAPSARFLRALTTALDLPSWQTIGRLMLSVGPPLVRGLLAIFGPTLVELKQGRLETLSAESPSCRSPRTTTGPGSTRTARTRCS